jgi:DNA modification methylase
LVWNKKKAGNILLAKKQPMKIHEDICVFYDDAAVVKGKSEKFQELRNYFLAEKEKCGLTAKKITGILGNHMGSHYFTNGVQWTLPTRDNYEKLQSTGFFNKPYEDLKMIYEQVESTIGENRYYPQMKKREKVKRSKNYGIGETMGDGIKSSDKVYEYTHTYPTSILEFSNASQKGKAHPTQKPVELFQYLIETYTNPGMVVLDNCMGSGTTAVAALNTGRKFIGFETEPAYIEIANKRIDDLAK